jgi:hypothetical protein
MSQLGGMELYLQVNFFYFSSCIFMTQRGYVRLIVKELGLNECNTSPTPMAENSKLSTYMGEKHVDIHLYQKMVGKLIYLTNTLPNISYVVGVVSKYMATPQKPHMEAIKKIFRYLCGTIDFGLMFTSTRKVKLEGFIDVDWACDINTRKSTIGYAF